MNRLLVTADIHGSLGAWMTIKSFLKPGDGLAVAGDLFDTRYGMYGSPDFQPDTIREEIKKLKKPFFYVYGNCDVAGYCPGYKETLAFTVNGGSHGIWMHHGHKRDLLFPKTPKIVIQGHTHLASLTESQGIIHLNPGSLSVPRNNLFTYGIIDAREVRLVDLKTGETMASVDL